MKMSDRGLAELAGHEGIVPAPYIDSVGVWTYGVGHTSAAGFPDPANMKRGMPADVDAAVRDAMGLFRKDVKKYEDRVNAAIRVPLEQHEFDALVSFDYNTGGINRAKLTAAINAGDKDAARHFMGWTKPKEIIPRRKKEQKLFAEGVYSNSKIPVWNVDDSGHLRGILKTIPVSEAASKPASKPAKGFLAAIIELIKAIFGDKA